MECFNFQEPKKKKGKKPQLFLVLDTETATLPFADGICRTAKEKQTVAISKPLVYDLGWQIVDRKGNVYSRHNFLITEIFCVPAIFDTAYYKEKKPLYFDMLAKGEITKADWAYATKILEEDLARVDFVGAFNSMFDYKKAIPFTEKYINKLESVDYYSWEQEQKEKCQRMLHEKSNYKNPNWDGDNFDFRDKKYPLFDLWGIACERLINNKAYKDKCLEMGMLTASGQFFKSSAETTYRHIQETYGFIESHTALDDAIIESQILTMASKKGKLTMGLQYFPFQMLGKTTSYIFGNKKKVPFEHVENVIEVMEQKLQEYNKPSNFSNQLESDVIRLMEYQLNNHNKVTRNDRLIELQAKAILRRAHAKEKRLGKLKVGGKAYNSLLEEIEELMQTYRDLIKS